MGAHLPVYQLEILKAEFAASRHWQLRRPPTPSGMRTLPGYKALMRETGLTDYRRETGDWGDVCRPTGDDDFECG